MKITHKLLQRFAMHLPLRIIDHEDNEYLRRYYLGTFIGVRIYLHNFVASDPVDLHNHPWRFGISLLLSGTYQEERRWCRVPKQRTIRWFNLVNADTLHRVLLFSDGAGNPISVWSLFLHTRLLTSWAQLKDKGSFSQYVHKYPNYEREDGHSTWHKSAKKGHELLNPDGSIRVTIR